MKMYKLIYTIPTRNIYDAIFEIVAYNQEIAISRSFDFLKNFYELTQTETELLEINDNSECKLH